MKLPRTKTREYLGVRGRKTKTDADCRKFGIAHLSDLHFGQFPHWINPISEDDYNASDKLIALYSVFFDGKIPPFYPSAHSVEAAVGFLSTVFDQDFLDQYQVNAFMVTGDLATTGSSSDLAYASQFFETGSIFGLYDDLESASTDPEEQLAGLHKIAPVALLPGNHDRFKSLPLCLPNSLEFENVFGNNWDSFGSVHQNLYKVATNRAKAFVLENQNEALLIVSIDFSLKNISDSYRKSGFWLGRGKADVDILGIL